MKFAILLFVLVGCAHYHHIEPVVPGYQVKVDSISSSKTNTAKTAFIIMSGMKDVPSDDLRFRKYADIVAKALVQSGFHESGEGVSPDAVIIKLSYGISEPRVATSGATTRPNYRYNSFTKRMGVGRLDTTVDEDVLYVRSISLKAYNKRNQQVWATDITSEGYGSDLAAVFPFLVSAGINRFGENTVEELKVVDSDDSIAYLRRPAGN